VSTSKALLEPLRVRVRRLQFTVGLGFLALVLGSMLSVALTLRLIGRVEALPFEFLRFAVALVLEKLWVLAVLPLLCYGAARVIELRSWPTALGAVFSGQFFIVALDFVRDGIDGWVERGWLLTSMEWGVLAVGVVLSHRAVIRGRSHARKQAEQARQRAAAREDEYAGFLREAERAGEKLARPAPEPSERKPQGGSKAPAA
jgi:heme exporter protein D